MEGLRSPHPLPAFPPTAIFLVEPPATKKNIENGQHVLLTTSVTEAVYPRLCEEHLSTSEVFKVRYGESDHHHVGRLAIAS